MVNLSKTPTLPEQLGLPIDAIRRLPEVRATLAYPANHPLGKINARVELSQQMTAGFHPASDPYFQRYSAPLIRR